MKISFDPVRQEYRVETANGGTYYITERERKLLPTQFEVLQKDPKYVETITHIEDTDENTLLLTSILDQLQVVKRRDRQQTAVECLPGMLQERIDLGNLVVFGPHEGDLKGYWASIHAAGICPQSISLKRWPNAGHGHTPAEAMLNAYEIANKAGVAPGGDEFK